MNINFFFRQGQMDTGWVEPLGTKGDRERAGPLALAAKAASDGGVTHLFQFPGL
ncbi:MAG: hypothetical protein GX795_12525 [Firmicutes bacterium]|nr:hypothetical protein [Bacillota bacterium]